MSQPANQKPNFMSIALLMMTAYLGFMLINGNVGKPSETRSSTQILGSLKQMSFEGKDHTIAGELQKYQSKIDEEAKTEKWTPDVVEERKTEGRILAAHTALRAGIAKSEIGRVQSAFQQLDGLHRSQQGKPIWDEKFSVPTDTNLVDSEMSLATVYDKSVTTLSAMNRKDKIIGIFPGYEMIDFLVAITGRVGAMSYTIAALILAFLVRLAVYPLSKKQIMHSRQMMQLVPLINQLKAKHKNKKGEVDSIKLQTETMALYKEYGLNPMEGCGPAFLQMPLFLLVFQCMMHYRFEFQKGIFLWINPTTSAATNGLVAPNLGTMDNLLLVIYGISMVVTTMLQPVSDPTQVKQQRMMGMGVSVIVTISMFFYPLPSAFVLYWIFLNILSMAQTLVAYRQPLEPLQKVQTIAGGVPAKKGFFDKLMDAQSQAMEIKAKADEDPGSGKTYKPKPNPGKNK